MAANLFISQKTVKNHLASIYQKLDARDRTQAVLQAVRMGIVQFDRPEVREPEMTILVVIRALLARFHDQDRQVDRDGGGNATAAHARTAHGAGPDQERHSLRSAEAAGGE